MWSMRRLRDCLNPAELKMFAEVYHIESGGNFTEESTGERTGANIPHRVATFEVQAQQSGADVADVEALQDQLAAIRAKLLSERLTWPQPHKDDKVLTSWNGLMIGSLAHAGRLLNEPRYIESAERAAEFILDSMVRDGKLLRSFRAGQAKLPGYLDDYAYFAHGLVELYELTGDENYRSASRRALQSLAPMMQRQPSASEDLLLARRTCCLAITKQR